MKRPKLGVIAAALAAGIALATFAETASAQC